MNLLAIDTSTDYLNIAIMRDSEVVVRLHRKMPMMHSTMLIPKIAECLKKAKMTVRNIDGICVTVGPGSFTGLRIGVTTVKGISYAIAKPIVAVPTMDAIAQNAIRHIGAIVPVLDARKGKVYACIYKSDGRTIRRLSKYLLLPFVELMARLAKYDKVIVLGDLNSKFQIPNFKFKEDWHPRAEVVARLGEELFKRKKFVKVNDLEPMYLYSRECDITGW